MSVGGGVRLLRVKISTGLEPWERIAVLAHELQHVLEVAAAPEVVDTDGMRRLFERIGHPIGPTARVYETAAAQAIERRVRDEIARVQ